MLQTIVLFSCISLTRYGQQSNFMNYQGIASDASKNIITETTISLQIVLKFGSETATENYNENHNVKTELNTVPYALSSRNSQWIYRKHKYCNC